MPTIDNEYSTPKITPTDGVKIPSVGDNSGYQLDEELREYIQNGVTGVTEQYSTLMTYAYGKRLKHEGVEYRCIVPVESPEIFDPDKWVKVDLTELDKRVLDNASAINAINDTVEDMGEYQMSHPTSTISNLDVHDVFVQRLGKLITVSGLFYTTGSVSVPKDGIIFNVGYSPKYSFIGIRIVDALTGDYICMGAIDNSGNLKVDQGSINVPNNTYITFSAPICFFI